MRRLPPLAGVLLLVPVLCLASSVEPDDVRISDPGSLRRALAGTGQSSDLARLAGRVDTALLVDALRGEDPVLTRGVLSIVPHVPDPAVFLPVLVDLSTSPETDSVAWLMGCLWLDGLIFLWKITGPDAWHP